MYQKKMIWMVVSVVFLSIIVLNCSNKQDKTKWIFFEGLTRTNIAGIVDD